MPTPKSQLAEYRRELRTLARLQREAEKPLRQMIAAQRKYLSFAKAELREHDHARQKLTKRHKAEIAAMDKEMKREAKLTQKRTADIRQRRAVLEGRLA